MKYSKCIVICCTDNSAHTRAQIPSISMVYFLHNTRSHKAEFISFPSCFLAHPHARKKTKDGCGSCVCALYLLVYCLLSSCCLFRFSCFVLCFCGWCVCLLLNAPPQFKTIRNKFPVDVPKIFNLRHVKFLI
jgi:hypothetical protein